MKKYAALFLGTALLVILFSCNHDSAGKKNANAEADTLEKVNPLSEINRKIAGDSTDDRLYIQRARYYLSVNKTDSAFRDILIAIDMNRRNPDNYVALSDAYLVVGNANKCKEALDKALALEPGNREALQKLAELYLIIRDYDETYRTVDRALKADPVNPEIYLIKGMALLEQSDTAAAINALKKAVYQNPDFYEANIQLGIIYGAKHDPLAVEYFNTAINIYPENSDAYYNLGMYYQENGEIQKAVSTYRTILEMDPGNVYATYNLGYVNLVYLKDFNRAIEFFTKVVQTDPSYAEAYYNRGYAYELLGRYDSARSDYRKTLEVKTNYPKAIDGLNRLE